MKIVLSRKGFDTGSGGVPSPIVAGRPVSLPIPQDDAMGTSYADLGLGPLVEILTRGRITRATVAHHDPLFDDGVVFFGQAGAAQSHLNNQGVGPGDVFLFFGLFQDREDPNGPNGRPHHRIFGWMRAERSMPAHEARALWPDLHHPHLDPLRRAPLDTFWTGPGGRALSAPPELRLTAPDGPLPSGPPSP